MRAFTNLFVASAVAVFAFLAVAATQPVYAVSASQVVTKLPRVSVGGIPVLQHRPSLPPVAQRGNGGAPTVTVGVGPTTGKPPKYLGGEVGLAPKAYLLFWGSWWVTNGVLEQKTLANYFAGLGINGDNWSKTLHQYYMDAGYGKEYIQTSGIGPVLLGGSARYGALVDPSNPPTGSVSDDQLAKEAALMYRVSQSASDYDQTVPLVVLPPRSISQYDQNHGTCGHHNWNFWLQAPPPATAYSPFPWAETSMDRAAIGDCNYGDSTGPKSYDGLATTGLTITLGHEWAEAVTDPFIPPTGQNGSICLPNHYCNAYRTYDPSGKKWIESAAWAPEVGDGCRQAGDMFRLTLATGRFWVQMLYSDSAGGCVKGT